MTHEENMNLLESWGSYGLESETMSGEKIFRFALRTTVGTFYSASGTTPTECAEIVVGKVIHELRIECCAE